MNQQLPFDFMLPTTRWAPPLSLPDMGDAKVVAIDTENRDPGLTTKGPSWIRGDGHCAGVSIATDTGFKGYFPVAHLDGGNLDRGTVSAWLRDQCRVAGRDYVFAQAAYDLGWLETLGVTVAGRIRDVSICDTLIDEESPTGYSLEALGQRWLGAGKDESQLREAANAYGYRPKEDLWKLHARFVGTYAETDAVRTLQIYQKQLPVLREQNLLAALDLESELTPILYRMTKTGIPVDLPYAHQLHDKWLVEEKDLLRQLGAREQDIWNPDYVRHLCDKFKIPVPEKEEDDDESGKLDKKYLAGTGNKEIIPFLKVRAINRCRKTYLKEKLIDMTIKGRLHPQYVQMRSDQGGCRTPRLASKNPNAQQFPKRSKFFASKDLRKCLVAEDGCQWAKLDFWSQEPTIQVHYGLVCNYEGADKVVEQFAKGVKFATYIEQATGGRLNYDEAKSVSLGRTYGMGKKKMSREQGIDEFKCGELLDDFDKIAPFIKLLADHCSTMARTTGYILMPFGYRRRFNYWQPVRNWDKKFQKDWDDHRWYEGTTYLEACDKWGRDKIQRAHTYKAFNALCQGTGAIQAKKALVDIAKGVVMPTLPVHDEINSANITSEKQALQMKAAMEGALKLRLPVRADMDLGSSWQ